MASTPEKLMGQWTRALHDKRPRTKQLYVEEIGRFGRWLEDNDRPEDCPGDLLAVCKDDALAWINDMKDAGKSPNTVRNRWIACRAFYRWLAEEGEIPESPFARVNVPKADVPPPDVLTDDQCRALFRACEGNGFLDRRDAALLRFMLASGLRSFEVVAVRTDDLDMDARVLRVPDGKGGKFRLARFDPETAKLLDRYDRARDRHPHHRLPALWLTQFGPLTRKGLPAIIRKRARMAGIEMHPHMLRHTFGDRLKEGGMSDEQVMKLGGWTSTTVMHRYGAARAQDRALNAYDKIDPMGDL